ncbi:fibroblast growth factor-binding protein 2b [Syngnathus typhle]|uniref:fibroblast growth factor-binding protein 2b n=1 Tax=Syngnathus typhle TaxID=161592 RepID=UPI002A6AE09D|nr:fibroblast growth factor-binding protein 2b [Syngnathus typhle]
MWARVLVLVMAAWACRAQINNGLNQQQQRSIWDEPIRFSTKSKDACTMVVSGASDYTRLRVSCKGPAAPSGAQGRVYYCDFQGKPNLCRAYSLNPRHYFTQIMWELRKLNHACQGAKLYRPPMCKRHPDEVQMTFLSAWPRAAKPTKPAAGSTDAQPKPVGTQKPQRPQTPVKPQAGKAVPAPARKTTPKPAKTTVRPSTDLPESKVSRLATEYCWKSFHGICSYVIGLFKN